MSRSVRIAPIFGLFMALLVTMPAIAQSSGQEPTAIGVTYFWQASETIDLYHNGSPLRPTLLDFRMRADESAKPVFTATGTIADGDVLIAGIRSGTNPSFTMVAVDTFGAVVWSTSTDRWSAMTPPTDGSFWYDPIRRQASPKRPVIASANPALPQADLAARYSGSVAPIRDSVGAQLAFFFSKVNLAGANSAAAAPSATQMLPATPTKPAAAAPVKPVPLRIEAEKYAQSSGQVQPGPIYAAEGGNCIGWIENGTGALYKDVAIPAGSSTVLFRVSTETSGGRIELRDGGSGGAVLAQAQVGNTGGWDSYVTLESPLSAVSGRRDLYLAFSGGPGYLFNVDWLELR